MSEKNYAPAFWVRERETKFGTEMRVSLTDEFLQWARTNADAKGYTNILIKRKRDTSDPKKPTHYGVLDDWKPSQKREAGATAPDSYGDELIPF